MCAALAQVPLQVAYGQGLEPMDSALELDLL